MGVDLKIHWNFLQEILARQGLRFHTGELPEHEAALAVGFRSFGNFSGKKHDPRCPSLQVHPQEMTASKNFSSKPTGAAKTLFEKTWEARRSG